MKKSTLIAFTLVVALLAPGCSSGTPKITETKNDTKILAITEEKDIVAVAEIVSADPVSADVVTENVAETPAEALAEEAKVEVVVKEVVAEEVKEPVQVPVPTPAPAPVIVLIPEPKPALADPSTLAIVNVDVSLVYRTTASVNFRVGPDTAYTKIKTLSSGLLVTPAGKYGAWFKVTIDGKEGFIHGDYVSIKTKEEAAKPAPAPTTTPPPTPAPTPKTENTYVQGVLIANKGYGLSSSYAPGESNEARSAYNKMSQAASVKGHSIRAFSTYRSYTVQKNLYSKYVANDGVAVADTYSARPGHSEHQTGLAFDIGWAGLTTSSKMGNTKEGIWMNQNSYRYGFILRYPEGKSGITGYKYEPWHFRYVGVDMATKIFNSGLTLDEYLGVVAPNYR